VHRTAGMCVLPALGLRSHAGHRDITWRWLVMEFRPMLRNLIRDQCQVLRYLSGLQTGLRITGSTDKLASDLLGYQCC